METKTLSSKSKAISPGVFDKEKLAELRERDNKWHELSMNQLSFYNNLLIALGAGFLAFIIKEHKLVNIHLTFSKMEFYPTVIALSRVFMVGSVFFGLLCGFNRLVDFRYIHRLNKLKRELYEKNHANYGNGLYTEKIKYPIYYWFRDAVFFNASDEDYNDTAEIVKDKIHGCSKLIDRLGKFTRNLLRIQIVLFLLAMVSYAVSFK